MIQGEDWNTKKEWSVNDMLSKFKWLFRSQAEQITVEKRVINIMTRLKIEDYHFNWDRDSCYIEFSYQEQSYRLDHSITKAKEKGVFGLRNGLDCLMELVLTLEDLCKIIERGTYKLETWVAGMELEMEDSIQDEEEYEYPQFVQERAPRILRMRN